MFVGRSSQLNSLEGLFLSEKFKLAIVTGARSTGKSELLREFAKGKKCLYFSAFETTGEQELALLNSYVNRLLQAGDANNAGDANATQTTTPSLLSLLDTIIEESKKERLLFVIDDYPAFAKSDASFEKLLLSYLEKNLKEANIMLVIAGNQAAYMNRHCLGEKTPLGKLSDITINVDSINYLEAIQFCITSDDYTKAVLYGVSGGIPAILARYKENETYRDFIIREILSPDAKYFNLTQEMMSFDLRELSYYNRLLTALAAGHHRVLELSAEVDKPKDIVVPYLNTLISLGMVERTNAITEETNRKKTRYLISNSFVEFWFKFVAPHLDMVMMGEAEKLYDEIVEPNLGEFMDTIFPKMCKDHFERRNAAGTLPFTITRVGRWWQNAGENEKAVDFDLLAVNDNDENFVTVYCKCIFGTEPVEIVTLKDLIGNTVILKKGADVYYMIFSAADFSENTKTVASTIKNIVLVSLEDLYKGITV